MIAEGALLASLLVGCYRCSTALSHFSGRHQIRRSPPHMHLYDVGVLYAREWVMPVQQAERFC